MIAVYLSCLTKEGLNILVTGGVIHILPNLISIEVNIAYGIMPVGDTIDHISTSKIKIYTI